MALDSMAEILEKIQRTGKPFWEIVLDTDVEEREVTPEASFEKMRMTWRAMLETDAAYRGEVHSVSGLVGGDGARMRAYAAENRTVCGPLMAEVIATALCTGESNACMRRIVAAPTAGACGVLPAVLIPVQRRDDLAEDEIVRALYVAAGIGAVIGYQACIAGASGGCQAEIGSASAMAAGALTALRGGSAEQICDAVAMALKNLLGLICDPVAGLVEVPCVKRNVVGAVNAVSCADMALAGVTSRVPVDQVIVCMGDVGRRLPVEFRETAQGGLAATPFGEKIKEEMRSARPDSVE
ncbi:MAG: L-serine ammonia-lyase, iron-sulfur-dependent, subunit alpha [Oscillibacter sp.]|jgi:L-serine dehydratase|nr:L-serine ammonia-lyase, iron-sulfur-dependent, subunit alpha [Oscillibacter sp.]